ncbi:MAG: amidohydrolase [Oscillospiraceae bacterium]
MQKLYYNGFILTMQSEKLADAVLTDDGIIIGVGDYSSLQKQSNNAEKIDLLGKTMLPAFIDAHSHFSSYATSFLQVSLENCKSFAEISESIKKFVLDNNIPPHQWVVCRAYDHNSLLEKRHPDLALLDECCENNPLVIQHACGHIGVFNSMALKELHVTADTLSPVGGIIGCENGKLTGYMEENAFFTYLKKVPMSDINTLMSAFQKAQNSYASHGIATIQEGMAVGQLIPLYNMLLSQDALKLDVVAYADLKDEDAIFSAFPKSVKKYDRHFKLGGYKIFLDGSPQGRTAWMKTPYIGDEDYYGYGTMQDNQVVDAVLHAGKNNMQILAHCNGDAAAEQYINAIKTVSNKVNIKDCRPVIIHAQLLSREQLSDVKSLGIIPSFFIAHIFHWGDVHIKNFGLERASKISLASSALKHNILFTFHQDTPVIEPNMLETIWCAVNRVTKGGIILGKDECISVYDALKSVTINAAYQYFEEDKKGSISPSKYADFVILSQNPLTVNPMELRNIEVLATIKNDEVLYQKQ